MRVAIVIVACVVAYAAVSTASFNDALALQSHYCAQVAAGAWPDYKDMGCSR